MTDFLEQFLWIIYPYAALAALIGGIWYKYSRRQLTITSKSSELLESRALKVGSQLFHWGIIFVLLGHLDLLVPVSVFHRLGISNALYHTYAGILGGFFGIVAISGLIILIGRRLIYDRVFTTTELSDFFVLVLLAVQVVIGLSLTLGYDTIYGPFPYRYTIGAWFRGLLTLRPDISHMVGVPLIFQIHVLIGFLLFAVTPYTRLIHIISAPVKYLVRKPIVRRSNVESRYGKM